MPREIPEKPYDETPDGKDILPPDEPPVDSDCFLAVPSFFIYDHLGNTRVLYTPKPSCTTAPPEITLEHVADYYPFGAMLREYIPDDADSLCARYYTTQHERDQETGLDYRGARYYDSDMGRFWQVDPLAEEFLDESPFIYAGNNPVFYIDMNGAFKWPAENAEKYPTLTKYLNASINDVFLGTEGVITEILDSDRFLKSMIKNSEHYNEQGEIMTISAGDILMATLNGYGPEIRISDDLHTDEGMYFSYEADGIIYLSARGISELENAKTEDDKKAALTYLVSTIYHEYLEMYTDDDEPLLSDPYQRQGAAVMEHEVWGLNLFGIKDGKYAIKVAQGEEPISWDENDNPIYINDQSAIPNVPK